MIELANMLLKAVDAELKPLGFKLVKSKDRSRRTSSSISAAYVRVIDKGKRTEKYHLLINDMSLKTRAGGEARYQICPSVSVRFEEVERIFHRTSGYDSEQQEDSTTVGIDLWRAFGKAEYQIPLNNEADLTTATARALAIFHEKAEPYFTQFSTLAAVDSAINDQPGDDCLHRDMALIRCVTGLIVAKLVGRDNYDQLVSIYRETMRTKSNHFLPKFEATLGDLANLAASVKRHVILGRKLPSPLADFLKDLEEGAALNRRFRDPFNREQEIKWPVMYASLEHLGYGPIKDLAKRLNQGVDDAAEYFLGSWWKGNEDAARALDKSRPDRALAWFGVLPKALLLCGLTGRWDDASKICSWFDETIEMEYQAGQLEDEYMALFLCIASNLRPQPMPGAPKILAKVKACRTRRPRLLCAAWEAAVARDQNAFDKALKDTVEYFLKNDAENAPNPNYWVALDQSLVWLIAERNGLKFPKLPEKLDAALVRRQTIGLAKDEGR